MLTRFYGCGLLLSKGKCLFTPQWFQVIKMWVSLVGEIVPHLQPFQQQSIHHSIPWCILDSNQCRLLLEGHLFWNDQPFSAYDSCYHGRRGKRDFQPKQQDILLGDMQMIAGDTMLVPVEVVLRFYVGTDSYPPILSLLNRQTKPRVTAGGGDKKHLR